MACGDGCFSMDCIRSKPGILLQQGKKRKHGGRDRL
nr:MAG TPA: hypothetical protein [Caudoviricetes sp.]